MQDKEVTTPKVDSKDNVLWLVIQLMKVSIHSLSKLLFHKG